MNHTLLTILLFVAAMAIMFRIRDSIYTYSCPQCGTKNDKEHHKDCSWK